LPLERDADEPLEGGPRRILHDGRNARGQRIRLSNSLIKAEIRGVQKPQRFKRHGRNLPSPGQRKGAEV
jgi:hypothetical protein